VFVSFRRGNKAKRETLICSFYNQRRQGRRDGVLLRQSFLLFAQPMLHGLWETARRTP